MEQYGEEKNRAIFALHFAKVKLAIVQPKKTHTVKVKTKSGGTYSYKYADLADVDAAIMAAIKQTEDKDHNPLITYFFDITNNSDGIQVVTVLMDAQTGFMMRTNKIWFKNFNIGDAQSTASLISYAKRYSLSGAFGIASEDDDDAQNVPAQPAPAVDHQELQIIWDSYIKDHNESAKEWLFKKPHNEPTLRAIKQLLGSFKFNERLNKAKKKAQEQKKAKPKKAVAKKPKPETKKENDDEIEKLVDGGGSSAKDNQTSLFGDIIGD